MTKILISAFLFTIIWKLSGGIALNCTFEMTPQYSFVGSVYQCNAGILWDNENRDVITVVYGAHQNDSTHEDVQGLSIENRGMELFPVNIEQFFPNIIMLRFPYNSISYVSNQHLIPLPNLVYMNIAFNRITSIDSNMFSGLKSMQYISFLNNTIQHVGHDVIIPNSASIHFTSNTCISSSATTPDAITVLKFDLLVNCPPTISQIEATLESRNNWLTSMDGEVQSLVNRTNVIEQNHSEMDNDVESLTNTVADLENQNLQITNAVTELRQSNAELINEMTELTDEVTDLQQSNLQLNNEVTELNNEVTELTNEVTELNGEITDLQQSNVQLTNEVTDLQQSNVDLTSRNSHLESRVGFLDARAGSLEVRVAILENIIERKLGLKIDEAISDI